jgi:hypothetical protein
MGGTIQMNRKDMIEMLINDDLTDWHTPQARNDYLWLLMENGFVGYASYKDEELQAEMKAREL